MNLIIRRLIKRFLRFKNLKIVQKKTPNDYEYNEKKAHNQKVIDLILDKISKSGYNSLSKKEKIILHKYSKKNHN